MPKMTVLMPVYNAERFLREAIDSILVQNFTDFEFLIIDDCSTDSSAAIIQSYTDPRIRYFRNEQNKGISPTLNKGIELATCDWIARMDADDICYPDRLQKQYDFIQQQPDGALYSCKVKVVTEDGVFIRIDQFEPPFYYYNLTFICWIYHPSIIFSKKAVQSVGGYAVPYAEDFELFWQLTRHYKHYNLPKVLMDYRVTTQSLHQVLKKQEYARAQQAQILRNIRYYVGDNYTLPETYIECLQHNFEPLLQQGRVSDIVDCIRQLDFITERILQKDNINRHVDDIKEAAYHKRKFIIDFYFRHLPRTKAALLLIKLGQTKTLLKLMARRLYKQLKPAPAAAVF